MRALKESFFGNIGIGKTAMIEKWLKEMGIKHYTINSDYTIDVNGSIYFGNKNITELPEYIQFGIVKGDFIISGNPITTLRGCPKEVGEIFNCCSCKNLTSLEGAPKYVRGEFYCNYCKNLKSLEGSPKEVGGNFQCIDCNNLTSLKGAPKIIYNSFYCNDCNNLTSLKGAPKKISNSFDCTGCTKLKSLEGAPKEVGRYFYCDNKFIVDDVKKYCNVKNIYMYENIKRRFF